MTARNLQWPSVPGREGAKNPPGNMCIATWNVRTLNGEENLEILLNEMRKFKVNILGISETHWNDDPSETLELDNYVIIQSA